MDKKILEKINNIYELTLKIEKYRVNINCFSLKRSGILTFDVSVSVDIDGKTAYFIKNSVDLTDSVDLIILSLNRIILEMEKLITPSTNEND